MKRPLTLNELLEEAEKALNEDEIPDNIFIFPPENDENTDEDSGDENLVTINNLPGNQLRAEAEAQILDKGLIENQEIIPESFAFDSDDDLPLSVIANQLKACGEYRRNSWVKQDLTPTLPEWSYGSKTPIELSPIEWFFRFFDDEVINLFVHFSNTYAKSHNRTGDIQINEMRCFFAI